MPKGYIEYQDRIGSQHELTTPGNRKSDVVISAIEKCQKLEKQLKIAIEALTDYAQETWWEDAVDDYDNEYVKGAFEDDGYKRAQTALMQIKELDK